jgi:hypothetical protein
LLIGRSPLILQAEQSGGMLAEFVGGGLFLLALTGVWAAAWWFARDDRRFSVRSRGAASPPPAEQFLKELNLAAVDQPINNLDRPNSPSVTR